MTFLLFLIGSALLGIGLVRRLFGSLLGHVEQVLWGLVVGWMLTTCAAYLGARVAGQLSFAGMLFVMLAAWVVAVLLWLPALRGLRDNRAQGGTLLPSLRFEYGGLLLTLGLFAPIYIKLFRSRMLHPGEDGLYSGGAHGTTSAFTPRSPVPSFTGKISLCSTHPIRPRLCCIPSCRTFKRPCSSCSGRACARL